MFSEIEIFTLVTFLSIAFIILINRILTDYNILFVINFICFTESIVISFFFDKYPIFFSFLLLFVSLFYLSKLTLSRGFLFLSDVEVIDSIFYPSLVSFFRLIGIAMIIFVIVYEFFSDRLLSTSDVLVLSLSSLLIYYKKIPKKFIKERDFMVLFFSLLSFLIIFPNILYKIKYGYVGIESEGSWFDNEIIVYNVLGRPLSNLLSLMGYSTLASGKSIFFENLDEGVFQEVTIAKSCSGIISIQIFTAALFSYLWVEYKEFNINFITFLILGIILSYLANLFRMATIVLSGHYWGMEVFDLTHKTVGWIIFTFWIFIFWQLMDKFKELTVIYSRGSQ